MIKIRYKWHLHRLPENCECGQKINFEQALSCKKGGFITIRHNQVRYITANLLKIISNDVKIEAPLLEVYQREQLIYKTVHEQILSITRFWIALQKIFFDVRVFITLAKCYREPNLEKCYKINEKEKKKHYRERIQNARKFHSSCYECQWTLRKRMYFYAKL